MSTPDNDHAEAPEQPADPAEAATEDAPVEVLSPERTQIRELEAALEASSQEAKQAQARLRAVSKAFTELQSDFTSFRERQESLRESMKKDQAFSLSKMFFDPIMNLKRSVANAEESVQDEPFINGLRLVHHQFMESMNKLGLEEVPGEGALFDPKVHEALAVTPVSDPEQDGRILAVHAVGYAVNGQALQPAQVVVAKYTPGDQGEA